MDKKNLEIKLESLDDFSNPRADLEQYKTPNDLAADLLWNLHLRNELKGNKIVDLGCGTGCLAIGAKLLDAERVVGVDKDQEAIRLAKANASSFPVDVKFICDDVENVDLEADVVIQNPPFGSQEKGNDRPFLVKSLEIAPVVYSFHMKKTDNFIRKFVESLGGKVVESVGLEFTLDRTMSWHEKEKKSIEVNLYRFERK